MELGADPGWIAALLAGISLSAASGLRVFLPLLALGLAVRLGWMDVGEGFLWLADDPVLIVLAIAAAVEIGTYYIPLVDNLLDLVATPAAMAGGTIIVSSLLPEMNPIGQWTAAALLGGGSAGIVQGASVVGRGLSTTSSGGLANPLFSTAETGTSLLVIALTLLIPVIFGLIVVGLLILATIGLVRAFQKDNSRESAVQSSNPEGNST